MIARTVFLGLLASWRLAAGQGEAGRRDWLVTPSRPTVGDTVWIERVVGAPVGWRVRAARLDATDRVEQLADPVVERMAGGWRVRYSVVVWAPGVHTLALPPLWLVGPGARADSVAGGTARFELVSVLPDTTPAPKPALDPLRTGWRTAAPAALAALAAGTLLLVAVRWRRRPPRAADRVVPAARSAEVPDARWLAAGEPRAVAARVAAYLRAALARTVPAAHEALSAAECLETLERTKPDAPVLELRDILQALAEAEFAAVHDVDVTALAVRARALARELTP